MSAAGRAERKAFDFYKTPEDCVQSVLGRLHIDRVAEAFEPCLGHEDIARLLPVDTIYYCELAEGVDYLSGKPLPEVDLIITNPPFSLGQEFIERSLSHCRGVVCYLMRLNFLGSQKRKVWWQKRLPTHLYVLSNRPSFKQGGGTDATEYAWYVWDNRNSSHVYTKDTPGIYVI